MLIFLLNGLIFPLIGLELKDVIQNISIHSIVIFSLYAFAITIVAILIRAWRIFSLKKELEHALKNKSNNSRKITEENLVDFQDSLILSLSGMRGIVSLAIALGLPYTIESGARFPMRREILFITFAVILFSVIGQGLLLPIILKRIKKEDKTFN